MPLKNTNFRTFSASYFTVMSCCALTILALPIPFSWSLTWLFFSSYTLWPYPLYSGSQNLFFPSIRHTVNSFRVENEMVLMLAKINHLNNIYLEHGPARSQFLVWSYSSMLESCLSQFGRGTLWMFSECLIYWFWSSV